MFSAVSFSSCVFHFCQGVEEFWAYQELVGLQDVTLDKILADHRDQQEKVAEEMIKLNQSLKEQSAAAGSIIRGDTGRLEQSSVMAENNLDKLGVEAKRVGEFSARGNCRCWIWLMMGIVILTFVGG